MMNSSQHWAFLCPADKTGRKGFPKEAMLCAFIMMKSEGFSPITDLADYLENNRMIAPYCSFDVMKPLPSYWTYDRFLKKLEHSAVMSSGSPPMLKRNCK
ncbi:transposase [Aceticella autotrophica]|uniref:Transposase n=1 Tax=Aceticella autotrophica TaxID=2755338 RepID=A0A975AW64_9THEO|nr:transposase [Aceticella autotrophica]QSZ27570.1 transposase [Aceticella autotrophica]